MSLEQAQQAALIVTSEDMDIALPESGAEVLLAVKKMQQLNSLGFNFHRALKAAEGGGAITLTDLGDVATLLYSDWTFLDSQGSDVEAAVSARMFNTLTSKAREYMETHNDDSLRILREGISESLAIEKKAGGLDEDHLAMVLHTYVGLKNQSNSWIYSSLPSRVGQAYSSLAVAIVGAQEYGVPDICVTQTLTRKVAMHAHMHGLSTAFAMANGSPSQSRNEQINVVWQFNSTDEAFPLKPVMTDVYDNSTVVMIPEGWLHTIVNDNKDPKDGFLSLDQLGQADSKSVRKLVEEADFALRSSTHIYRPTMDAVNRARSYSPHSVWDEASMLAVNQKTQTIYLGDRHAMERRLAFWNDGKCCGVCTSNLVVAEDDKRETVSFEKIKNLVTTPRQGESLSKWTVPNGSTKLVRI